MSAHQGASTQPGEAEPDPRFIHGATASGLTDPVGLAVDRTDGAARVRLGALSGLEPEQAEGGRLILALERAAAPAWLAGLTELQPIAPSPFSDLIANLIANLIAGLDDAGGAMSGGTPPPRSSPSCCWPGLRGSGRWRPPRRPGWRTAIPRCWPPRG